MQALLLAAGRSTRFGSNKLLQPLADGRPMAQVAASKLMAAFAQVIAVVHDEEPELAALLERAGLDVTVCPHAREGLGASLSWGVRQTRQADGWLIALADMPWIAPETFRAVASSVTAPHLIAAPVYQGQRGHPVAFGRDFRERLLASSGDTGARHLLKDCASHLILLPCQDAGVLRDIDLPGQIEWEGGFSGSDDGDKQNHASDRI